MHVVITGGAHGIGRATVERLLDRGHSVTVLDSSEEWLRELPESVETVHLDVTDRERVDAWFADRELDALVNCAGFQRRGSIEDMDLATIRQHMETNYFGMLHCIRAALPALLERDGRIVNVSSLAAYVQPPYLGAYSASKAAVERMSDALRQELRGDGVEVVLVEPGLIRTGFNVDGLQHLETFLPDTRYAEDYRMKLDEGIEDVRAWEPGMVARVVVTALETSRPRARYTAPRYLWLLRTVREVLPERVYDFLVRFI